MAARVKIDGLKELARELKALGKHTTARSVARRVLKEAGKPIAERASALAPNDPATGSGDLKSSIAVSTKLNKRQRGQVRKGGKSNVEVYVGTNDPAGVQQEFGNVNHGPQPFMRPAWSATKLVALKIITKEFKGEILKAAQRLAKKAARSR